jgi:ribonuclease D
MTTAKLKVSGISIEIIETDEELAIVAKSLKNKKLIAFDTEFDRFKQRFGFTLLLLQLFDRETIYLVKVEKIKNLAPILNLFEDERIKKLVYSGSEDVQLLKRNNCNPKNLFDLQIASRLTNFKSKSFADLANEVLEVTIDKTKQTSNWSKSELDFEQLVYAAKDVLYLFDLYEVILERMHRNKVGSFIEEENTILENIELTDLGPKLNSMQRKKFSLPNQIILLELKNLIFSIAEQVNRPPQSILSDETLESCLLNKQNFTSIVNEKSCYKRYMKKVKDRVVIDNGIKQIFLKNCPTITCSDSITDISSVGNNENHDQPDNGKILDFKQKYILHLTTFYGEDTAKYIAQGFTIYLKTKNAKNYCKYKIELLTNYLSSEGVDLNSIY